MIEQGTCSACSWLAERTEIEPAPGIRGLTWWHTDPRAMSNNKSHPVRADFVPNTELAREVTT